MPAQISAGATGIEVEQVQFLLARRMMLSPGDVDGIFGPRTTASVEAFQSGAGLTADGIVGPATWAALLSGPGVPPVLAAGASGPAVAALQQALNAGRSDWGLSGAPLALDGSFGPLTGAAVAGFQSYASLPADSIVGYRTWSAPVGAAGADLAGLAGF